MAPRRPAPPRLAMASAAGAASIWFVHLAVSYALVPATCRLQTALPLLVVTVIGVAIGAGSAVAAARTGAAPDSWSDRRSAALRLGESRESPGPQGDGRHIDSRHDPSVRIATAGLALTAYFTFVMLLAALVPILVDPCA